MELPVSRPVRARLGRATAPITRRGWLRLAGVREARALAASIGADAGELQALAVETAALWRLAERYRRQDPARLRQALAALDARLGRGLVRATLQALREAYPLPPATRDDAPAALLRLAILATLNANPAGGAFRELFDDGPLAAGSGYREVLAALADHFATDPAGAAAGSVEDDLLALLRAPALAAPDSVAGQLRWIGQWWGAWLGDLRAGVTLALDVLVEEEHARWLRAAGGDAAGGHAADQVTETWAPGRLAETDGPRAGRYSVDREWMARVVLVAKSTPVWLAQLAHAYGRPIATLDAIPDEELAALAARGIGGLWLIGLWERSRASAEIKHRMGQPEALASAYAVLDYRIAPDLGGEAAFADLRERAARHGLRLAGDMVPNHMGLDSSWVIEHPERFIGLDESPFPAYRFSGPDLSPDPRVELRIEDGYWDRRDAAVVFERRDRASGAVRYLYHGNDGTSTPWNDTAQLDYLRADVREAVIRTIIEVARRLPIVRFDAAMTLARRHIQRLWYPPPGEGGAIPSRAEHGLGRAAFERLMPREFWREVVDRVATEAPDTLLLAEAFWLMESTFVRSFGMHRVYNSAFMHLLRDEHNKAYRALLRETLAFDPQILGRYVNFMTNPDERTAIDQFGSGERYAGVCTLMVTLPGLPLFGHGQVEGFTEQYGMEFRRPRLDEQPDPALLALHERRIFPLLRRRALFAGADEFRLYDVAAADGSVLEDVFAYSNRLGEERAVVLYHHRDGQTVGRARDAAPFAVRTAGGRRRLHTATLAEALGLRGEADVCYVARDVVTDRQHLFSGADLAATGLPVRLGAYGCQVFLDWRELADDAAGSWRRLAGRLGGEGVADLAAARRDLDLEILRAAVAAALAPERARRLGEPGWQGELGATLAPVQAGAAARLVGTAARLTPRRAARFSRLTAGDAVARGVLLGLLVAEALGRDANAGRLRLRESLAVTLSALGAPEPEADRLAAAVALTPHLAPTAAGAWPEERLRALAAGWLAEPAVPAALGIDGRDGSRRLSGEGFAALARIFVLREALAGRAVPLGRLLRTGP